MAILRRILITGIVLSTCGAVYALYEFTGPLRDVGAYWTASRLAYIDADRELESVLDLTAWIAGVASETEVIDNGDGTLTIGIIDPLAVTKGGTGQSTYTNGQLLIGNTTGNTLSKAGLTGTANQVNVTNGAGTITLSTPQDINTTSSPTFAGLTIDSPTLCVNLSGYTDKVGIGTATPSQALDLIGSLELEDTTTSTTGVIYKGANRFLHNFHHPTGGGAVPDGRNTFIGVSAGNFTMGSTATSTSNASYNVGIGFQVLLDNTTGSHNVGIGDKALTTNTTGFSNCGIGQSALRQNTTGAQNVGVGTQTIYYNSTGNANTSIGHRAGFGVTGNSFSYNTLIGGFSGTLLTTGSSNLFLGYYSGYNQTTNSNLLIIDNQDRTSAALELTNSLIYGVFNATPASQTLRFNAGTTTLLGNLIIGDAGNIGSVTDTDAIAIAADGKVTLTQQLAASGGILIPDGGTIGQAAGPLLTFDDTLNYLEITGCNTGIGTSTPANAKLVLNDGTAASSAGIRMLEIQTPTLNGTAGEGGRIDFTDNTNVLGSIRNIGEGAGKYGLAFGTWNSGYGERVRIDAAGKVGIGIAAPSQALDLIGSLELEDTTTSTTGVIYKGANRFLHNFHHPTGGGAVPTGLNMFVGEYSGNFTMGSTATETYHGSYNNAMGTYSLFSNTRGYDNNAMGRLSLYSNTTGHANTALGSQSGYLLTTGLSNIFLGYKSGYNQTTNSNLLIIDNQDRTSAALELTNSLIYGVFNATPASQTLRVNAALQISQGAQINGAFNFAADVNAVDDYLITLTPAPTAYTTGMMITFSAATANTGACTLNANALGAKSLKALHDQDPADNYIEAGSMVTCVYDGTNFQITSPDANP